LRDAELEFGLPVGLLRALAWQESGWQQHVVSGAGAVGLTQLLPSTAEWVVEFLLGEPLNWKTDARANARVGAAFLRHLINRAQGDLRLALASYYQGWSSVERYGLYDETRQYVENVLFLAESY
jgi:N-acetylmuramoyl-L-alanine amidase